MVEYNYITDDVMFKQYINENKNSYKKYYDVKNYLNEISKEYYKIKFNDLISDYEDIKEYYYGNDIKKNGYGISSNMSSNSNAASIPICNIDPAQLELPQLKEDVPINSSDKLENKESQSGDDFCSRFDLLDI